MTEWRPRVLVDANVLVSYLLPSNQPDRAVARFVELLVMGEVANILPEDVVSELSVTIARKRKLSGRISPDDMLALVSELRRVSIVASPLQPPFPSFVRDAKDDYLIAYAFAEGVEYLVTYDDDLLSLVLPDGSPRIVSPPIFLAIRDRLKKGPLPG